MIAPTPLGVALVIVAAFFCALGVVATFWFLAEACASAYKGRQR